MAQLTDTMILNTLGQNDIMGFTMAIIVIIFLGIASIIVLVIGRNKAKKNEQKINPQIIIGFIIIIFTIFVLFICIQELINKDDWYLTTATIINKYTETDSNSETRTRVYHYVEIDDNEKIKITDEQYNQVEVNDKVYVLIVNGNAYYVWNTNQYEYVGEKLE